MRYKPLLVSLLLFWGADAQADPLNTGDFLESNVRYVCFDINQTLTSFLDYKKLVETIPVNYTRPHLGHVQDLEIPPLDGCSAGTTEGFILDTLLQRELHNPAGRLIRISIFTIWPFRQMNRNEYVTINVIEGEILPEREP